MRWLKQYPITPQEVRTSLESIPQVNPPGTPVEKMRIGGIEDLVRRQIIEFFNIDENMDALLAFMRENTS